MSNLFPEIRDVSSLTGVFLADQFLTVGIEGEMDNAGSATVGTPLLISDPADASSFFGSDSKLTALVQTCLGRGLNHVWAVPSAKGETPDLDDRKAAWAPLEENLDIRIRLTDSETSADLAALAESCEHAELIQNKQFCVVGGATGTDKSSLESLATAIGSKRGVLAGPSIYDVNGNLLSGSFAAAYMACEIAKNPDITDDLDGVALAGTAGIEKGANGMPLFRQRANGGSPTNDFADLLVAGVSPYRQGRSGQAEFTHIRTTWTEDSTYDALMTLLVKDEVFIQLRALLLGLKFLRRGNTQDNRSLVAAIVDSWLRGHTDWVSPVLLSTGEIGFGVNVVPSSDLKKMTVTYHGQVVRNNQVIDINGVLSIPV